MLEWIFWQFLQFFCLKRKLASLEVITTLESGINIGVRLVIFEKKIKKKKLKNDRNALIDVKMNQKDQIILATGSGILADFWVPHEIDSWNFQHMLDLKNSEAT